MFLSILPTNFYCSMLSTDSLSFNSSISRLLFFISQYISRAQTHKLRQRLRTHLGRPHSPFSVDIQHASLPMSLFTLSAIRIDTQSCHPTIQSSCKLLRFTQLNQHLQRRHTRRYNIKHKLWRIFLFPLLLLQ